MLLFLLPFLAAPLIYLVLKYSGWFAGTPCTCTTSLTGKVAVVTGGNTGIGKETALELARRGAKVIIGCRDVKKAEVAVSDIRKETGSTIKVIPFDLADTESVENFSREVRRESSLDILVNNAGLMMPKHSSTKQGFELHMGVNHLGHHLLTHRVYDLLVRSGSKESPSRIINVSSDGHKFCLWKGIDVDAPNFGMASWAYQGYFAFHRLYGQSKLAQIYHAKEIDRRAKENGENVLAVSLHPGAVATEVTRYHNLGFSSSVVSFIDNMINYCGKTASEGAWTTIHCCLEDHRKLLGGAYYVDCQVQSLQPWFNKPEKQLKLFQLSEKLLGLE